MILKDLDDKILEMKNEIARDKKKREEFDDYYI